MYEPRYRPRQRTHPLLAVAGLLILALVTGGVLVAGGDYLRTTFVAGADRARARLVTPVPARRPIRATPRGRSGGRSDGRSAGAVGTAPDTAAATARPADGVAPGPTGSAPAIAGPVPSRRPRATPAGSPTGVAASSAEEVGGMELDVPGAAAADPTATRTPQPWADLRPRPRPGPFFMDIYKDGAMASEAEPEWCVPAACSR